MSGQFGILPFIDVDPESDLKLCIHFDWLETHDNCRSQRHFVK